MNGVFSGPQQLQHHKGLSHTLTCVALLAANANSSIKQDSPVHLILLIL